jgi:glycosyltransferase involved in cell wall biosynthesis
MNWFWLYRPTAPSVRAQAIQVVNMAHAMASRGHDVTLAVDPPEEGPMPTPASVLAFYGLQPVDSLHVHVLPMGGTVASLAFRGIFARWVMSQPVPGVVYARSKRYAREALQWFGGRFRLVMEQHEVDSVQAMAIGEDPGALRLLEREVFAASRGVVTNCPGTLALLREVHPQLPPALASHNATLASRVRTPKGPGEGAGYVGSVRDNKDVRLLASAARRLSVPVTIVGARGADGLALQRLADGKLTLEEPNPHVDVPDRLAKFRVLVLPLAPGLFGEKLTSPLKLWDYLASGVPIVAADLPTIQDAAPGAFVPYVAGDEDSLVAAIEAASRDEELRARVLAAAKVRTWDQRAAEVEAFVNGLAM